MESFQFDGVGVDREEFEFGSEVDVTKFLLQGAQFGE